jgi:hypothetical protein
MTKRSREKPVIQRKKMPNTLKIHSMLYARIGSVCKVNVHRSHRIAYLFPFKENT